MADEFSFDIGIVVHDHHVLDIDSIIRMVCAEVESTLAAMPVNVRVWHRPPNSRHGVHSTCDTGICRIEEQRR